MLNNNDQLPLFLLDNEDSPTSDRMVPLAPGPTGNPMQIAMNGNIGRLGLGTRIMDWLSPGGSDATKRKAAGKAIGGDVLGNAYERFQEKMAADRRAAEAAKEVGVDMPVGAGANVRPDPEPVLEVQSTAAPETTAPGTVAPGAAALDPAATTEPRPPQPDPEPVIVEDPHQHLYQVDDAEVDRILAIDTQRVVEPTDGVLYGGLRAEGKKGGVVDPSDMKIPDEQGIRQLIEANADKTAEALAKINPKNVESFSLKETERLADLLGMNRETLRNRLGEGFQIDINNPGALGAHVHAAKQMLVDELQVLNKLIDSAREGGTDKLRLAVMQQSELVKQLQAQVANANTEIARALNANKLATSADPALEQIDVRRLLDENGGADRIDEFMDNFVRMRSHPNAASKQLKFNRSSFLARGVGAAHEMWMNAILSGPWTHVKNTAGVAAALLTQDIVAFGTAVRQSPYPLFGKEPDVTFGDVGAKIFGQIMSIDEAIAVGFRQFRTREDQLGGYKVEMGRGGPGGRRHVDAWSAEGMGAKKNSTWGVIADWTGHVATLGRGSMRMLMLEDGFWKTIAYRGSLYEQAHAQGRAAGKSGEELAEHIADNVHAPKAHMHERAVEEAKYAALQTDQQGTSKQVKKALSGKIGRWVVPFYGTPANAIFWVNDHSPMAPLWSNRYKIAQAEGGAAAAKANTQWALGMGAAVGIYLMYSDDRVTGGLSPNKSIRAAYARQGIKPYHFRIGDTWYPYNTIEPVSTIMGLIVDGIEVANHPDTDDATAHEIAASIAGSVGYNLTNKTFMASVSNFIDAIKDPDGSLEKFFMGYAAGMFPASSMMNEFRRFLDPHMTSVPKNQRDTKWFKAVQDQIEKQMKDHPEGRKRLRQWMQHSKDLGLMRQIINAQKRKLPGLSTTMKPRRDIYGRPIVETRASSPYKPNPVDRELVDIAEATGYAPNPNPDHYSADLGFTADERDAYHKHIGPQQFNALERYFFTNAAEIQAARKDGRRAPKPKPDAKYEALKKAAQGGDRLAGEEIKGEIAKRLLSIRGEGRKWMLSHPEFGAFLRDASQRIDAAKQSAAQQGLEALQ